MTIVDDVALAVCLVSLTVVFIKMRRAYKRNLPDSDADETDDHLATAFQHALHLPHSSCTRSEGWSFRFLARRDNA
jgi:hypothetical protein